MKFTSKLLMLSALAAGLSACSDDKNDDPAVDVTIDGNGIEITADNLGNWTKYADRVAALLKKDAQDLYDSWRTSYEGGKPYADIFKEHTSPYTSAESCIEQIIDGCSDIANEVGTAKIGDPLELLLNGHPQQALFAVESWFSWHSREDYANNILSIRNSYYGSLDGTISSASMSALVKSIDSALDTKVRENIALAETAIINIPAPFRDNINSSQTQTAMTACANLEQVLDKELKPFFASLNGHDEEMQAIVNNYVDVVVLPTYKSLAELTDALNTTVRAMVANPSDATFEAAAEAWLKARVPWEQSEAFLFGPVDALGLDPNMDSWPLDQTAISNHIANGDFSDLDITDDEGLVSEASQNVRGFHTLEFLIFKDGSARKVDNL